jgi:hypothetical protein
MALWIPPGRGALLAAHDGDRSRIFSFDNVHAQHVS